jgi:hypothetical protein
VVEEPTAVSPPRLEVFDYWLNRQNCCAPEMGLVTAYCPLTTTGPGELVVQKASEPRFVVDCRVNPAALLVAPAGQ